MTVAVAEMVISRHDSIKNSDVIKNINKFIYSPRCIGLLGALTLLSFAFALELVFYSIVIVYTAYVGLFSDDFTPLMPLFVLCYVAPSINNNPGKSDQGLFYGASGIYLLCIAAIAVVILFSRIALDKEMGFKKLFTKKRELTTSMLILGIAYVLSGIGSEKYLKYIKSNLLFAFIQFASIFLLYFIFSAAIKWDKMNVDYFAWTGVIMGLVVAGEVACIYVIEDVVVAGTIVRSKIYSGWGCYNNIGAIISMSIPFAFHLACRKKRSSVYLILGCILTAAVVFSCSRGSMVGAAFAFAVSYIYTFFKSENKKEFRLASLVLIAILFAGGYIFREQILQLFDLVPDISEVTDGSVSFNDSGRFDIYINGLKVFLDNPIFGQTFYPASFPMYDFSDVEQFSSFFPPRWHNTVVQMLASCGAVGMLAYSFHRIDTIRLYLKKRNDTNTFIAISILTLLGMSLLDCHFFNVGPVFFYSMCLAVMEFGIEKHNA